MLFEHLGWIEVAKIIDNAVMKTLDQKTVTEDFSGQMPDSTRLSCSEYAKAVIAAMEV